MSQTQTPKSKIKRWEWESLLRHLYGLQASIERLISIVDDHALRLSLVNFLTSLYDFEAFIKRKIEPRYVEEIKPNLRPLMEEDIERLEEWVRKLKVVDD